MMVLLVKYCGRPYMNAGGRQVGFASQQKVGQVMFSVIAGADTVSKLARRIETKHSTVMEHLSKLVEIGVLSSTKQGRERKYKVEWKSLIDIFGSVLIDYEKTTAELLLGTSGTDLYPIPPDYEDAGQTLGVLPLPQRIRYPGYRIRDLEKRKAAIPILEKTLKEDRITREFIRSYLETYSQLYYAEYDSSLQASVKNFKDRLGRLIDESRNLGSLPRLKPKSEKIRSFLWFLEFVAAARIADPNEFACVEQMQRYLRKVNIQVPSVKQARPRETVFYRAIDPKTGDELWRIGNGSV
jgi:DNA-binding transcriptional ArsR family regulator